MPTRLLLAIVLLAGASGPDFVWDKPPEKWSPADAYRILRDSPWSPAKVQLDLKYTERHTDRLTNLATDSPANPQQTPLIRGLEMRPGKTLPPVSVLWWSSKTVRLAEARLRPGPGPAAQPAGLDDYVLMVEGQEQQEILRNAREDLHDTVFLELDSGLTLDLGSVEFIDGADGGAVRTAFHFPRLVDGQSSLNPEAERIVFHCRATAGKPPANRGNAVSLRVEFSPKAMKVRGAPDL